MRQSMLESRYQNDDNTEINLTTEETYRGRRGSASATLVSAAKTQPGLILICQTVSWATGFAGVTGTVQDPATILTGLLLHLRRYIKINLIQKTMKIVFSN